MRIAVLGGSGMIGSAVVAEAVQRGHEVTAVSRGAVAVPVATVSYLRGDGSDRTLTAQLLADNDAVVAATSPDRAADADHAPYLAMIAHLVADAGSSLVLVVGGFGSLLLPNGQEQRTRPGGSVEKYRREAETVATGLAYIRANADDIRWTYLCPPFMIRPRERTGSYKVGDDHPVGQEVSTQDFAVAIIDELENPAHLGRRFTVANEDEDQLETSASEGTAQ